MNMHARGSEHDFTSLLDGATKEELTHLMENEDKINELVCDHEKVSWLPIPYMNDCH